MYKDIPYFLPEGVVIKWLETPSVYNIKKDELYELDDEAFKFLKKCQSGNGCNIKDRKFLDYCLKESILTRDKVKVDRPPLIKSSVPSLRYLELQITDRCNLRCRHCYIGDPITRKDKARIKRNELSIVQIKKILTEFEEMQGLRVLITGGEPLLHSRFKQINAMLPAFFLRKILFTNGLLLNRNVLKNLNVDEIQISIDGLEKAHDLLRGKGIFKKTIETVTLAIDCGFEVSISTMIHSKNLRDFDRMENLFKGIGIKEWTVDVPCITGRLKKNVEFQLTPEHAGKYLKYGYGAGIHSGEKGFGCGLHLMSVMADGKAAKCTFYSDKPIGDIDDVLKKCWEKIKPIRLDNLKCNCKYVERCRGGCRHRAEILGDPLGKDLYRCALYRSA